MKQDRRGSWYLLTGIVLGIGLGLVYSWLVSPVKYIDAPPYSLREDYKEQYRVLVAAAYMSSGDLLRAQDRLAQLKDTDAAQSIAMQAQRALADGHPEEEVRALSQLAAALSTSTATITSIPPGLGVMTQTRGLSDLTATVTIEPSTAITATIQASEIPTATLLTPIP